MPEEDIQIDGDNFAQYFKDVRTNPMSKGEIIAQYTAAAELVDEIEPINPVPIHKTAPAELPAGVEVAGRARLYDLSRYSATDEIIAAEAPDGTVVVDGDAHSAYRLCLRLLEEGTPFDTIVATVLAPIQIDLGRRWVDTILAHPDVLRWEAVALTETWREHVARRTRCLEVRQKLADGGVHAINDLILRAASDDRRWLG